MMHRQHRSRHEMSVLEGFLKELSTKDSQTLRSEAVAILPMKTVEDDFMQVAAGSCRMTADLCGINTKVGANRSRVLGDYPIGYDLTVSILYTTCLYVSVHWFIVSKSGFPNGKP